MLVLYLSFNNTDIDECVEENKMDQCAPNGKCRDDEGTYTCVCDVGFKLTADGTTCEG